MRHAVIGTAGHIDHGKSALVLALTGTDPDRLQEEKARGITIDLGFAHTVEGDIVLSFVDVPGHERFVRNMLAGVGGMDLVMLHVAADESVMPQTREHFDICRLLGVPAGLVAITKSDLVDPATLDVVRLEVRDLVAGSFLETAPVVAVSARTGAGLSDLRRTLAQLAARAPRRPADVPSRLPIDRVFTIRGFGTVVTGTLVAGRIRVDETLALVPSGREVKVRGVQVHGQPCAEGVAGQRVAVNLAGIEVGEITRGETLTAPNAVTLTRRVDVSVELLPSAGVVGHGARVRFHQGTRELTGRVALAEGAELPPGRSSFARLHLQAPAALVRGDRFILRAYSPLSTIGGGTVLDPLPPRRGVRTAAAAVRFMRLADTTSDSIDAVTAAIEEAGLKGLPLAELGSRLGIASHRYGPLVAALERSARAVRLGDALLFAPTLALLRQQVVGAITAHHASHPLDEGMPREELRERLFANASPALFDHLLDTMGGLIVGRERIALRGHTLTLTDEEARARDAIVQLLDRAGLTPPDRGDLAVRVGAQPALVDRIVGLLVRQKVLVRIDHLVFHESALHRLKAQIRSLKDQQVADSIDVATFKSRYQVSRKYAVPLLEFLDRERVTRRVGEARQIL